jgi:hypothetical protein
VAWYAREAKPAQGILERSNTGPRLIWQKRYAVERAPKEVIASNCQRAQSAQRLDTAKKWALGSCWRLQLRLRIWG